MTKKEAIKQAFIDDALSKARAIANGYAFMCDAIGEATRLKIEAIVAQPERIPKFAVGGTVVTSNNDSRIISSDLADLLKDNNIVEDL